MLVKNARTANVSMTLLALLVSVIVFIPGRSTVVAQRVAEAAHAESQVGDVRIGVFGLFHPIKLTVSAPVGSAVVVHAGEERIVLEPSSGVRSASVSISGGTLTVTAGARVVRALAVTASGRSSEPVDFILEVPGKISRRYHGVLEIKPTAGTLTAVVAMNRETAVGSVVAAEAAPDAPFEALKAQAVATRSYFVAARGRHREFEFCDTTHCQFLREVPAPGSAAARAVATTRDLVLAYDAHPVAAMYTRSCSGRTRTPADVGLAPAAYPYYSVECAYCREHPSRWSSRLSNQEAPRSSDESARLALDRRLGWRALPSNDFVVKKGRDQLLVEGTGEGHGIGLCQSGAKAMASVGADFRQILRHYYPDTTVVAWAAPASAQRASALTARIP